MEIARYALDLFARLGIHPKIVSERLGHSSVTITLDTYSYILPGLQEAAARRFTEGLGSVPTEEQTEVDQKKPAKCR